MASAICVHLRKEDVNNRIQDSAQQLVLEFRAPDDDAFQYDAKRRVVEIVVKEIDAWEKAGQFWRQTMGYFLHIIEEEFTTLDEECLEAEAALDSTDVMQHGK
ncbi:hypothetical protein DPMN_041466 [Dreissena polymorpha]|uniref:Uncharacterized protein n=1 Tax=Dreissena polymorpha TaxID=45954 RepID=A0A9D4CZD5_DREPO|nr:hypothetical protein DPMN_041466 [Dreissena polymorpha]